MVETIMKRDGRTVEFKQEKIAEAVERAFQACGAMQDRGYRAARGGQAGERRHRGRAHG